MMTMLMPMTIAILQTSSLMQTQTTTYPAIEPDPSHPVIEEGTHNKTSPMSIPLQLMLPPLPFQLTQILTKLTIPSPHPHQQLLPMLTPLHLPAFQRHLEKLDNLQNSLQQLYKQTNWLIAALVEVTIPLIPTLAPSTTSPPPQMYHQPKYPSATTQKPTPPAPPEPSMTPSNNSQCANLLNIFWNTTSTAGTLPVILPNLNLSKVPVIPSLGPGHLPNIWHKPYTSQQFASTFLRFTENNYRPP